MADNFKFDYFYGSQAEQFSFFRLPKVLVRDSRFKKISSDAKILYGIMLDRMSLSRENRWIDKDNRVYIIFTLKEVMKEFECCQRKAGSLMAELDSKSGIGLIEKKRQGLGKPDLIYLKNFIVQQNYSILEEEQKQEETMGAVFPFQSGRKIPHNSSEEIPFQTGKYMLVQSSGDKTNQSGKEVYLQSSKEVSFKNGKRVQTNNTEYNNTDVNYIDSINPINPDVEDEMDIIEVYRKIVKENIRYEDLYKTVSIMKQQMLNEIVELMVEVLAVNRKTMRIAGENYPYQLVKSRFMCIGYDHVEYVLNCLDQSSSKIGNIKAYILTSLFNAVVTIDTYYTTAVHYDMAEGYID